ncbi:MAG: YjjG family noncanonical pyrimidine nucleotidase [Staphylococcus sp.]|nr:YjjG family noncanonical pyrimidine nucleotidase [Staphylococcus sp.]
MNSKWIWFDLDDTLVDFHTNSRMALRIIHQECGLDRYYPDQDEWVATYETHNHSLWDRYSRAEITQDFLRCDRFATPLRPHWTDGEEKLREFSWELDEIYLTRLAEQTALIDGAREILTHLRAHDYNIGILSNGFTDVQHRKLTNTGLAPLVDLVVLSDDIGVNKPDTRLYVYAMERAGNNDPEAHTMVGDNRSTDIEGAIRSGWNAIHLDPAATQISDAGTYLVTPRLCYLESLIPHQ